MSLAGQNEGCKCVEGDLVQDCKLLATGNTQCTISRPGQFPREFCETKVGCHSVKLLLWTPIKRWPFQAWQRSHLAVVVLPKSIRSTLLSKSSENEGKEFHHRNSKVFVCLQKEMPQKNEELGGMTCKWITTYVKVHPEKKMEITGTNVKDEVKAHPSAGAPRGSWENLPMTTQD